jgi:hypothetical protein
MKVAFYNGTQGGFQGVLNRLIRWWTAGPASHCELVFSDGVCASSSQMDGGVRFKVIDISTRDWMVVDVGGDEAAARAWFRANAGKSYDLLGDFGFVWRPIKGSDEKYFCSEAVGSALGFDEAWRFDPNTLYTVLSRRRTGSAEFRRMEKIAGP